jgi:hypothetical protein
MAATVMTATPSRMSAISASTRPMPWLAWRPLSIHLYTPGAQIFLMNAPLVPPAAENLKSRSRLVGLALRPDHFSPVPASSLAGSSLFLPCDPLQRARKV